MLLLARYARKKGVRILEFITFYQNALPQCILVKSDLTRVHCATFYQSALQRHGLHEDVTPSSRVDFNKKGSMVVMSCSDLPVKRCEGDCA